MKNGNKCDTGTVDLGLFSTENGYVVSLGTVEECADKCRSIPGCQFFTYGIAGSNRDRRCYQQLTSSAECPEGWAEDNFDFYQLEDEFVQVIGEHMT